MSKIELYQDETLSRMDKLIEQGIKVECIIADIPYGTTACKWDSIIPFPDMWERLNKLIKPNGAIVLFGSEPFSSALRMSNIKGFKYDWVWEKNAGSNFGLVKFQPMKEHENIIVFEKDGKRANYYPIKEPRKGGGEARTKSKLVYDTNTKDGHNYIANERKITTTIDKLRYPSSIQKFNRERGLHPTQKPIPLGEYLVKTYTNEGETVLDFTMGSGFIPRACNNLNRNCIGIDNGFCEKEKSEYYKMPWAEVVQDLIDKDNLEKSTTLEEFI